MYNHCCCKNNSPVAPNKGARPISYVFASPFLTSQHVYLDELVLRTVLCGTRLVGLWSTYLEQEPPLVAGTLACFQNPPGGYTAPRVSARPMGSANLTTGLVRTLWLSETDLHRAPVLKTSSKSGLPIAWITGYATIPQPPKRWF